MIDWDHIQELEDQMGPDGVREIADLFVEETSEIVGRLDASGDNLLADLHFIKGSAANLGMKELAQLCRAGELAVQEGGRCDVEGIESCFRNSCEALRSGVDRAA